MNSLIFLGLLSPVIRLFPKSAVNFGGKAVWISPLFALPVLFLLYGMINRFMKNCEAGEGLGNAIIKAVGSKTGKVCLFIIGIWLMIYTGFVVRSSAERLLSSIYPNGGSGIFAATLLISATIIAAGKLRSLGRMAEIFASILTAVLVPVLAAALFKIEITNILPLTVYEADNIALGAVLLINVLGIGIYASFLGKEKDAEGKNKFGIITALTAVVMIITVVCLGNLGEELIKSLQHNFFVMIRDLKIIGAVERIEAVVIIIWVITDLIYISLLLKICGEIGKVIFEKENKKKYIIFSALFSVIPWFFVIKDAFTLHFLSGIVIPIVNILIVFIIIPLLFVVGRIRQKI